MRVCGVSPRKPGRQAVCILEMRKLRIEMFMQTETTWPGSGRAENPLPGESASSNSAALLFAEGPRPSGSPTYTGSRNPLNPPMPFLTTVECWP